MVTDMQLAQFREQGYFILEDLFGAAEINELTAHIDAFSEQHEAELQRQGQQGISRPREISFTTHLAEQDAAIRRFVAQPKLVAITTRVLGPDVALYWDQAVYKRPEAQRDFPWHQDNGYIPVEPAEYLTCWLALVDATIANGCIWVIPGSHKHGVVEHKETPIGKQCYFGPDPGVAIELRQGSMACFSSLLFHRSGPNLSAATRKGYVIQYAPAHVRHAVTGAPLARLIVARGGQAILS
jgi:phytanoyl-CoA hydroxylase